MNEDQFSAMLAIIVPPIIEQITKNSNVNDEKQSLDFISPSSIKIFRTNSRSCGITVL